MGRKQHQHIFLSEHLGSDMAVNSGRISGLGGTGTWGGGGGGGGPTARRALQKLLTSGLTGPVSVFPVRWPLP